MSVTGPSKILEVKSIRWPASLLQRSMRYIKLVTILMVLMIAVVASSRVAAPLTSK